MSLEAIYGKMLPLLSQQKYSSMLKMADKALANSSKGFPC